MMGAIDSHNKRNLLTPVFPENRAGVQAIHPTITLLMQMHKSHLLPSAS